MIFFGVHAQKLHLNRNYMTRPSTTSLDDEALELEEDAPACKGDRGAQFLREPVNQCQCVGKSHRTLFPTNPTITEHVMIFLDSPRPLSAQHARVFSPECSAKQSRTHILPTRNANCDQPAPSKIACDANIKLYICID